jgi:hypothetical protein
MVPTGLAVGRPDAGGAVRGLCRLGHGGAGPVQRLDRQGLRRNLDLPLVGFVRSIGGWGTVGVIVVVLQFALVGAALVRPVSRRLWWLVLAYGLVMTLTARPVWADWAAGVRVTLPVVVLALLSVRLPDGVRMALGRGRSRAAPAS